MNQGFRCVKTSEFFWTDLRPPNFFSKKSIKTIGVKFYIESFILFKEGFFMHNLLSLFFIFIKSRASAKCANFLLPKFFKNLLKPHDVKKPLRPGPGPFFLKAPLLWGIHSALTQLPPQKSGVKHC